MNLIICDSNGNDTMSVASYTYTHIKAELIVHYDQWFLITLYACHMHSTWPSQSLSFISPIILIIFCGRYNLWSYISWRFLHYLITFGHKILRIDQQCSQTQSTVFAQCHSQIVTPTAIKILCKHTHMSIFKFSWYQKGGRRANLYEPVVSITAHYYPLKFLILQSLFLNTTQKYFKFPILPKFQTMYQLGHDFLYIVWYSSCAPRIYNRNRNVVCQCTASL